ncbi:MAG: menaquinone biosynthesis protein [Fimbriimonadaceae bacterium]
MSFRVGCVPYVNALPLVSLFSRLGDQSPVRVVADVPSALPAMLDAGEVDAVLASSFDALTTPGRRFAEGVCIGTDGPAESVRLFSQVPFDQISRLALDRSSLTSNHLAQILLAEQFGIRPETTREAPELDRMLAVADAAILIGDRGYLTDAGGCRVLDLGEAWTELTGLPFVWALWIGNRSLGRDLVAHLQNAMAWGLERLDELASEAAAESGWPLDGCRRYLRETMRYPLDDRAMAGLREFRAKLVQHGFAGALPMPEPVAAGPYSAVRR